MCCLQALFEVNKERRGQGHDEVMGLSHDQLKACLETMGAFAHSTHEVWRRGEEDGGGRRDCDKME